MVYNSPIYIIPAEILKVPVEIYNFYCYFKFIGMHKIGEVAFKVHKFFKKLQSAVLKLSMFKQCTTHYNILCLLLCYILTPFTRYSLFILNSSTGNCSLYHMTKL